MASGKGKGILWGREGREEDAGEGFQGGDGDNVGLLLLIQRPQMIELGRGEREVFLSGEEGGERLRGEGGQGRGGR